MQASHLHMLVEANDKYALARGMQVFGISAAKHINAAIRDRDGRRRRGAVFPDRYHVRILREPLDVRNTLAYVLNNWRHHGADRGRRWLLDPYSSAITFDGWRERIDAGGRFAQPRSYPLAPLVWEPETWLVCVGARPASLYVATRGSSRVSRGRRRSQRICDVCDVEA